MPWSCPPVGPRPSQSEWCEKGSGPWLGRNPSALAASKSWISLLRERAGLSLGLRGVAWEEGRASTGNCCVCPEHVASLGSHPTRRALCRCPSRCNTLFAIELRTGQRRIGGLDGTYAGSRNLPRSLALPLGGHSVSCLPALHRTLTRLVLSFVLCLSNYCRAILPGGLDSLDYFQLDFARRPYSFGSLCETHRCSSTQNSANSRSSQGLYGSRTGSFLGVLFRQGEHQSARPKRTSLIAPHRQPHTRFLPLLPSN